MKRRKYEEIKSINHWFSDSVPSGTVLTCHKDTVYFLIKKNSAIQLA